MGAFLLGLVLGGNLVWVFMSLRRDGHWREYNGRRGSNPPPPGRKPAPPAGPPDWRRSFTHECINPPTGDPPLKLRKREPAPPAGPPEQPLTAQLIRYWAWEQEQVRRAAAGQSLIHFDEGPTQRGNGNGGPTTPKPPVKPQPTGGQLFINNKPPKES